MQVLKRKAIIIGGGIGGPVAAMALKRIGVEAVIYEAHAAPTDVTGAFLNLAPNGVNILKTIGVAQQVASYGFACPGISFWNSKGKRIGELNNDPEEQRYGAKSILIKRGLLHKALREEALRQGITMEFGKRLQTFTVTDEQGVIAQFEDGTQAEGDFLLGCDGIQSRTRQVMLPDAPKPVYTGLMNFGGFANGLDLPATTLMQMVFGRRAFFGYAVTPTDGIYWFSNTSHPNEPSRAELKATSDEVWLQRLLELHRDDPAPVSAIIRATRGGELGSYPTYDMPPLPTWHKGPVCLIGDAAHATSPHVGQGASLALEDALILAKCLRDAPDLEQAFTTFETLRKARAEKLIVQARRTGNSKVVSNPIQAWFRDLTLPFFLRLGAKSTEWVYAYQADWDQKVA